MKKLVIGTRGSPLALAQTNLVQEALSGARPDIKWETKIIQTTGDKFLKETFDKIEGKGIFVKEIETALLEGTIDLAVHSMKDLPTQEHPGLLIAAVTEREDSRDVLVSPGEVGLADLSPGMVVGTSSTRRMAQLLNFKPFLKFVPLRGNVNTRLRKMREEKLDAIVLAYAGLKRVGLEREIREVIPLEVILPAVGQGALGIQVRAGDRQTRLIVSELNHFPTQKAISAERAMLKQLGGGCQVPIGAHSELRGKELKLVGLVASPDGRGSLKDYLSGPISDAEFIGRHLARRLLKKGAGRFIPQGQGEEA